MYKRLLNLNNFHAYQQRMANHMVATPQSMIWGFMGCGKTICTETAVQHLIRHSFVRASLVVAPVRVVESVWMQEAKKWAHTQDMTFSMIRGTPAERMAALYRKADMYLINYEMLQWLAETLDTYFISRGYPIPFDHLVLDEVSKVKNSDTVRSISLAPLLRHFPRRVGLTGTPAPNGLIDLHGQYLMIDGGRRLGIDRSSFRSSLFESAGYSGYSAVPTGGAQSVIHQMIGDITLELAEEDHLNLPDLIVRDVLVDLPTRARRQYDELELQFFTELDSEEVLEVENEVSKINKLLQFANGAVYLDPIIRNWEKVHDAKLDALDEIVEETAGSPILLAYMFKTDAARILKKYPHAVNLSPLKGEASNRAIKAFSEGKIRMMIGHPASMGHGTDGLQMACNNMVWFGNNWSLEYTLQFNKRVHRQGRGDAPVVCHRIMARDTMDQAVAARLASKNLTQKGIRSAVADYRRERYNL